MDKSAKTVLAIETSCDETAISLVGGEWVNEQPRFRVFHHAVSSQTKIHAPFGGVVPNLARREHEKNLPILFAAVPIKPEVDLIAVTAGPGLEPALWVGLEFARALARERKLPLYPTNHLAGHLYSPLVTEAPNNGAKKLQFVFPVLALIVSGGHTELVLLRDWGRYEKLGETRDDAVGETYDKVARLLDLPYPGGPALAQLADRARRELPASFRLTPPFPRPMQNSRDLDFSFSGLKTAVRYRLAQMEPEERAREQTALKVALAFEEAALDSLIAKTKHAAAEHHPQTIVVGGGVAANHELVRRLETIARESTNQPLLAPSANLTGDNATMIAAAAFIEMACGYQPLLPAEPEFAAIRVHGEWPLRSPDDVLVK